jgi:hypothetical protein
MASRLKRSRRGLRGHANLDWELEPAIDRSAFWGLRGKLERATHERLAFEEFKRLALPHLRPRPINDWEFLALASGGGRCSSCNWFQ